LIFALALLIGACGACGGDRPKTGEVTVDEALELWRSGDPPLFLDVRSQSEYEGSHIPGALNIPHTELAARIDDVQTEYDGEVIVYCERGGRARSAADVLRAAGFVDLRYMKGHMRAWNRNRYPVTRGGERGEAPGASPGE